MLDAEQFADEIARHVMLSKLRWEQDALEHALVASSIHVPPINHCQHETIKHVESLRKKLKELWETLSI